MDLPSLEENDSEDSVSSRSDENLRVDMPLVALIVSIFNNEEIEDSEEGKQYHDPTLAK